MNNQLTKEIKKGLFGVFLLLTLSIQTQGDEPKYSLNGYVRNYAGVLLKESKDYSIIQNTLDLTLNTQKEKLGFLANVFMYQYPTKENTFDIRELYMDFYSEKVDVRVGKQQIIWGQADGVFITDVVSPKNLTEFLLWDFNEIRMGVTAAKVNYYVFEEQAIEWVWIPVFTPTLAPEEGSIWHPRLDFPVKPVFDMSQSKVSANLENSELFMRYSLSQSWIDLQLMGAYTWDDDPTIHLVKRMEMDSVTQKQVLQLTVRPEYHRLLLGGGSFSTDIVGFVFRGEGAYYKDKYFITSAPSAKESVIQKDYVNYVGGLDKTMGNWRLSTQFIQKIILDYDDQMKKDEVDNLATIMVNRTLFREKVRLELFSYVGFNHQDALIRLRGYYFPYDGMSVELGANLFVGDEGTFGQYNENSMLYTRVKYSF